MKQPRFFATWCALAYWLIKKKTDEEGSHGDDQIGALLSSVRRPSCFVYRLSVAECARAAVPGIESVHPPDRQVLSKTGLKDESVTFATRLSNPLFKVIEYLAKRPGETAPYPEYLMEINAAAEEVGVISLVPSEARH